MWPCTRWDTLGYNYCWNSVSPMGYNHINSFTKYIFLHFFISIVIILTDEKTAPSVFGCRFVVMCVHVVTLWTIQTFPEEKLSVCWAVVITFNCDWHKCFTAMRPVMWLAERVFINHHTSWSIFTQPFYTLHCCTYMNQNSRWQVRMQGSTLTFWGTCPSDK